MEVIETNPDEITLRMSCIEITGLCNVINHALHAGFVIDEDDCHSLTAFEWDELQSLNRLLRQSIGVNRGGLI